MIKARPRVAGVLAGFALIALCALSCTRLHEPTLPGPPVHHLHAVEAKSLYGMVATGTVDSTRAGVRVLESGGNAIDAAVAAAFALGVVDPGDSGLGGTTYMLIHLADGRSFAIDGSAVVPMNIDREHLTTLAGNKKQHGIELSAVPGSLAALDYAVRRYGTRPLSALVHPAIELAERGYRPNAFQRTTMESYLNQILESRYLRFTVLRDGVELPDITDLTCRPELARTLRRIADRGAVDFYRGEIAGEISTDMKQRGGYVRQADLGVFRIREIEAVRGTYRGLDVLSFPWPGSGKAVVHALNILENFSPAFLSQDTVDRYQTTAESFHIAIEDFHRYSKNGNVDPANIGFDYATKEFAAERARLIRPGPALKEEDLASTDRHTTTEGNTTQVSVVDRFGNAVSLTQTLGRFFGAKVATPGLGFPYNNLLEGDTALRPRTALPTAMAPTIVIEDGEVLLVLGSAGSDRIPGVIASIISNVVDRSANLGEAVSSPRILWGVVDNPGAYLEIHPPITGSQVDELEARGYEPVFRAHLPTPLSRLSRFGAVNAVHLDRHTRMMTGVADPRRFGFALGAEF